MIKPEYPFFAKDTIGLNYYKVISESEGLKVGKYSIAMEFMELDELVRWKTENKAGDYKEFVPVEKEAFNEHYYVVRDEINKSVTPKS